MATTKARIRKKADRTWMMAVFKRWGWNCEVCGEPSYQAHHYFYKGSYPQVRYDTDNGISICRRCHFLLHHRDPKMVEEKIIEKRGKRWLNRLIKKSKQPFAGTNTIKYFKEQIEKLK
jgi:hypothetical protein